MRYVTYFFKFWDTLHISGTDIARDFKFGVRIDSQAGIAKKCKSRSEGSWLTSRNLVYNFGTPLYL